MNIYQSVSINRIIANLYKRFKVFWSRWHFVWGVKIFQSFVFTENCYSFFFRDRFHHAKLWDYHKIKKDFCHWLRLACLVGKTPHADWLKIPMENSLAHYLQSPAPARSLFERIQSCSNCYAKKEEKKKPFPFCLFRHWIEF